MARAIEQFRLPAREVRGKNGRTLTVEFDAVGVRTREKGRRGGYVVSWQAIHDLGARLEAEHLLANRETDRKLRRKARRGIT